MIKIKITSDTKIKILQAFAGLGFIYTMVWQFDWRWLIPGLVFGWFLFLLGHGCSLHKYSSHRSFEPKNVVIKTILLFFGTLITLGSNIGWAATHRKHHKYSDTPEDPHSPNINRSLWRSIRLWFFYFPTFHVNPRTVKDLTVDPLHKFFHNHYFKIIIGYIILLAVIDIKLACYFYFVPVVYCFIATGWVVVVTHSPGLNKFIGYTNFDSGDLTFNSRLGSLISPGDGNHNNHHARPGSARNKFAKRD